ncbi:MAG: tetratricopeptide repeat protein [Pseudanabaenales cyanobacterium]|nr:tetratricopeptide repeat protein [Pseudanabaenales cyanobacterium]
MTQPGLTEWDEDVATSPDEEYAALVRAIRWATGFGLLFVQCTPAEGEQLIERVRADVAEKTVEALRLETEIDDLYETLAAQPGIDQTNVLFISGLEKSLTPYIQAGYGSEGDYYALDKIPKILGQLNLQRERFKERFKLCFVFLAPRYAMKYFIRRAADFFDWRSGVWEFVSPQETLQQETQRVLQEGDFQQYLNWTPQQRRERCLIIEDLIAEGDQSDEEISQLWIEQGNILMADQDYNTAIACYDQALAIKPDNSAAFYNKGTALDDLGRKEEAITCYDQALAIKPDYDKAFYNKGTALYDLGHKEEAIACYDQALEFKPDDHLAWNNRGNALSDLGRYEAAIQSYDKALQFKPDFHLGWYNKASCYGLQGGVEETIAALQKAIELNPDYREKAKTDSDFDPIRDKAQFQAFLREQFLLGLNTSHEGGG